MAREETKCQVTRFARRKTISRDEMESEEIEMRSEGIRFALLIKTQIKGRPNATVANAHSHRGKTPNDSYKNAQTQWQSAQIRIAHGIHKNADN
jgi:hypothetical protein